MHFEESESFRYFHGMVRQAGGVHVATTTRVYKGRVYQTTCCAAPIARTVRSSIKRSVISLTCQGC
jgi:hypothetical protein